MSTLLHLDRVGRRFGGLTALHEVTLDVAAGARHAVIGPNGAGKTTLINLIAGSLRPSTGRITFAGNDITALPPPIRARHGISRTWQHPAVFARLTVTDNLTLAVTHRPREGDHRWGVAGGPRHAADRNLVGDLLDRAGLTRYATTPAGQLPYGLRRYLELAMALALRPRLLLLDEPSAGLAPDELTNVSDLLTGQDGELTVLLVDHHLELVWALADTVTVLHHGQHLATGSPAQVRADPQVQAAYLTAAQPAPGSTRTRRPAGAPVLLTLHALRAGYHGAPAIDQISFDVASGEAIAVLGRNGAGKTTLLNTIAGLHPAQAGRIELTGRPLTGQPPHHIARAGIALVPQGRRLFGPLTVTEHLICAQATRRRPTPTDLDPIAPETAPPTPLSTDERPTGQARSGRPWTVQRVFDLLPALARRAHHPARLLSGGEQQMLALARALLTNPRLLLLDEPSEGLAPAVVGQLIDVLADLTAAGLAVLLAEQNLAMATAVTDRVIALHSGRIALTCPNTGLTEPATRRRIDALLSVGHRPDSTAERTDGDTTPGRTRR